MTVIGWPARMLPTALAAALLASGVCLPPSSLYAQRWSGSPDGLTVQMLSYPDDEGYLEFTAQGNRGSHFTVRVAFKGFDVIPQLPATRMRGDSLPAFPGVGDSYDIVPRALKVTTDVSATYRHEITTRGFTMRTTTSHKIDHAFDVTGPAPPEGTVATDAAMRWLGTVYEAQPKHDPNYLLTIHVHDQTPSGGTARVELKLSLGIDAPYTETQEDDLPGSRSPRTRISTAKYGFQFSALESTRAVTAEANTRSWPSIRYSTGDMAIGGPISWQDLRFTVSQSHRTPHIGQPGYGTLLSDTDYLMTTTLRIGPTKPVEATLEPVGDADATTPPVPGTTREYTLTIGDSILDDVDGLRVTLADATSYPGVATNGGNHVRGDHCDDCRLGRVAEPWSTGGSSSGTDGKPVSWVRTYRHYNNCPIDDMPDLFFQNTDNEGWIFGAEAIAASQSLKYVAAQQMTREGKPEKSTRFTVRLMDSAAFGQLSAEVRIAGGWYGVAAKGATADRLETHLMVPLDRNGDGIHDAWAGEHGVTDAGEDARDRPPGAEPGDGLTAFEEYRGIYTRASLRRLDPTAREVFVHDYSGKLGPALSNADYMYVAHGLRLVSLREDEFKDDVINWMSESPRKRGDQYILVLVPGEQVKGAMADISLGRASHVGPPTRDAHTILLAEGRLLAGEATRDGRLTAAWVVAHEVGHNINIPHHGTGDGLRVVDGKISWIACLNGQHSGQEDCIMRYRTSAYFFNGRPVPERLDASPVTSGQLVPFTVGDIGDLFCETPAGASLCKDAQPGSGSCLTRIKVRSY